MVFIGDDEYKNLRNIEKKVSMILKLALIGAYDSKFRLIDSASGEIIENTNILELINVCFKKEKSIKGFDSFIQLLKRANITADEVNNEIIKAHLTHRSQQKQQQKGIQPKLTALAKRKLEFEKSREETIKKRKWTRL